MIKIAVVGYGNVGKCVAEAVSQAPDMALCGLVRRNISGAPPPEFSGVPLAADVLDLPQKPDVAVLCVPTRTVPEIAAHCLSAGISTVDCFDIHSKIPELCEKLSPLAVAGGSTSVVAAGWDPGSDSVVRALLMSMAPKGITYTNFGPGMSMGHSVALRAIDGVLDAVSYTIPLGSSVHRRMCYVQLAEGFAPEKIRRRILEDDYFKKDETHIKFVKSVEEIRDQGHAVSLMRRGVSGVTQNQNFEFSMSINNPALTAQIMVSCARAATRQSPGCYTTIELPPVDLLPGERSQWIKSLV